MLKILKPITPSAWVPSLPQAAEQKHFLSPLSISIIIIILGRSDIEGCTKEVLAEYQSFSILKDQQQPKEES